MLIAEHEDNSSVLESKSIVEDFEILAEGQLVVTATQRYVHYLQTHDVLGDSFNVQRNDTIRYDTIDDLNWKTDRQAASLIYHMN